MLGTDVNGIQPVLGDTNESQSRDSQVTTGHKLLVWVTRQTVLFRWSSEKEVKRYHSRSG